MRERLLILNTVIREGLSEKGSLEPNLERGERAGHCVSGRRVISGVKPTDTKCLGQQHARSLRSTDLHNPSE